MHMINYKLVKHAAERALSDHHKQTPISLSNVTFVNELMRGERRLVFI